MKVYTVCLCYEFHGVFASLEEAKEYAEKEIAGEWPTGFKYSEAYLSQGDRRRGVTKNWDIEAGINCEDYESEGSITEWTLKTGKE